ncbi:uncharacterized protein LOC134680990 [Mytilus trossulus]|uniref:uncharacterized protein LOC134680990 n=1 Tax=Mytilus trossulus TaxID=6551 RepID=UPI003004A910
MGTEVLFFVPNIIGYFRLALLCASLWFYSNPVWFLSLYGLSAFLDGFDGYFARKLNQTSVFGAWFDVVIDNISRGFLWCLLYKWGYGVILIEWLTFVCTHKRGANWRIPDESFPLLCKLVMQNCFKSPLGIIALTGVHCLPVWLYACDSNFLTDLGLHLWLQYTGSAVLVVGRLLALRVEIFYIMTHIRTMLDETASTAD